MRLPKGLSITTHNGITVAKLYDTNIVIVDSTKGIVTLNSGGWLTKHTKKCSNLVLAQFGLSIVQRDFKWYVIRTCSKGHKQSISFQDNLEVAI